MTPFSVKKWKHTLDLGDVWSSEDSKHFKLVALNVVDKLKLIDFGDKTNEERDGIIEAFSDLILDETATVEHFDSLMDELYDFGDKDHILFIRTF